MKLSQELLIALGVVVVIAVIVVAAFLAQGLAAENSVIKIGVIAPLTGEMSNWGESMKGGIELVVDEKNNQGGINGRLVSTIFEDNKACDAKETVSAMRKLVDVDKVEVVMVACSGATLAAAPIAEEAKVVLLTPVSSAAKISEAGDFVFRTCISDNIQGKSLAKYVSEKLGFKKIGVIYVNNDYGVGLFDTLKSTFGGLAEKLLQKSSWPKQTWILGAN